MRVRIWYLDGSYQDIHEDDLEYYECDPSLHRIERIDKHGNLIDENEVDP